LKNHHDYIPYRNKFALSCLSVVGHLSICYYKALVPTASCTTQRIPQQYNDPVCAAALENVLCGGSVTIFAPLCNDAEEKSAARAYFSGHFRKGVNDEHVKNHHEGADAVFCAFRAWC